MSFTQMMAVGGGPEESSFRGGVSSAFQAVSVADSIAR